MSRSTLFDRMVANAKKEPHRHVYRITTHPGMEGFRLSLDGGWGNLPYPTAEAAAEAAAISAAGDPYRIIHQQADRSFAPIPDQSPLWLYA